MHLSEIMIPPLMSSTLNGEDILGNKGQSNGSSSQNKSGNKSAAGGSENLYKVIRGEENAELAANFGGLVNSTGVMLCGDMLENSGNAYDLHKWVMDKGYLCPVLFKSYAVYTTRGAAANLSPAIDWVIH